MRLHRFYLPYSIQGAHEFFIADAPLLHQWKDVFRLNIGDSVILFDESGYDYTCRIKNISRTEAILSYVEKKENTTKVQRALTLYVSLIKKDRFEWVLEKGTELGVLHFVPLIAERSQLKNLSLERSKKIIVEAVEQSGFGRVPTLEAPIVLEKVSFPPHSFVLDMQGSHFSDIAQKISKDTPASIFIGPEGGWSDLERTYFKTHEIVSVHLGESVLRAETAAIAAASLLLL